MKKIIGVFLSLVLVVGIMSGCTTAAPAISDDPGVSVESEVPEESKPIPETSDSNGGMQETVWPRTMTDAAGHEVILEAQPERITLLHTYPMEYFFALGVPPTASAIGNALGQGHALETSEVYKQYLDGSQITDLGSPREINLEAVLESTPDVIVTFAGHAGVDELYDQLTQIAPVVLIDYTASWQEQLAFCAQIVGKENEVQAIAAEIERAIADVKEVTSGYTDRSFALFRTDGKDFIARGDAVYYETFGLTKPSGFSDKSENISLEAVAEINPYYIVFQHNYEASVAFVEGLKTSSVWQSLDAVQNGRIYYFDENMNTFGPLTLRLAAEKLTQMYTEG